MKQLEFEPKAEKKNKTFYLSLDAIAALQNLADSAGVSQNTYLEALLKREAEIAKPAKPVKSAKMVKKTNRKGVRRG